MTFATFGAFFSFLLSADCFVAGIYTNAACPILVVRNNLRGK